MNTPNTTPALPAFTVTPTSMRGQSLLQWRETPGATGLRSLQMPTHIAKAFAAVPDLLAALERIAEMTCEDTGRNFDEWGEAACFTDCKKIASECLANVKGRAS